MKNKYGIVGVAHVGLPTNDLQKTSNPILDVSMVEFENSLPQDGVVTLLLE
ncbi:hypothetical protein [Fusicatenibacter sp.]